MRRKGRLTIANSIVTSFFASDDHIGDAHRLLPTLGSILDPPIPIEHVEDPVGGVSAREDEFEYSGCSF